MMEGKPYKFEAIVESNPMSNFYCYRDNAEILNSSSHIIKYDGVDASLKITELFMEDSGKYTFKFTNTQGEATTSTRLYVYERPN